MNKNLPLFSDSLLKNFKFQPTIGQQKLFLMMDDFLKTPPQDKSIFVLKGYAGTGKTSFLASFIKTLPKYNWKSVLLAPTGRAAKVMTSYTNKKAFTVHKKIYKQKNDTYSGNLIFEKQPNLHENTIFIVDEASMMSDSREFGQNGLLHDLISFVFESNSNKLLFLGDDAQLPPVNMAISPALDVNHLMAEYKSKVFAITLTDVTRQEESSGILHNATLLRKQLTEKTPEIQLETKNIKDFFKMTSEKIEDGIRYAYDKYGRENTIIITRSNRNAVLYNRLIRNQINFSDSEIDVGDLLMVVRNNYTILDEFSDAGFIANGEFAEIKRLGREEEMHGFRFQNVTLQLIDYPNTPPFETLVLLETLYSNAPNLSQEQNKALYESVLKDYDWVKTTKEKKQLIKSDKYLNALQVKFAYALTCHKAQGGQWNAVFIDQIYLASPEIDQDLVRWLYTAITRGINEVFLINFQPQFFVTK